MRSRVLRGLAWKVFSQLVKQGSRVAVAIVLARLLTPEDFGLAGMVLVFSALVFIFSDLSLGAALVQRRELTEEDRSTVFWTSLGAGAIFTLAGIGVAGPIADFYGEPEVRDLFIALSFSFVVTALGTTQKALLTREMSFRALELRQIAGTLAGAATGITVAALGGGAWAIIVQQVTIAAVSTALLWGFTPWKPRFVYSLDSLKSLGGFSGNVFGTRLLFYANRNADNLLIGRFLGPSALGAYSLAYNVMLFPFNQIASPIQEVLFPAFARMQDEKERMAAAWLRVNRLVGAISVPVLVGLIAVADDFVPVVLGDKWHEAIPVIQVLAWVGILQSLQRLNSSILQACDRTGWLLGYGVTVLVASLVAFVCGLPFGIVGVAAAYAISSTLVEPIYSWMTAKACGTTLLAFGRSLAGVAQASILMFAAVLGARWLMVEAGVPQAARLGLLVALGALVYLPALAWRAPEVRAEIEDLRRRRRARRSEAAESAEAAEAAEGAGI